jgi:hypothetical protein
MTAFLGTIQVTVGIGRQHHRWMIVRTNRNRGNRSIEARRCKVKLFSECLNDRDRSVPGNEIIEMLWTQNMAVTIYRRRNGDRYASCWAIP